MIGIPIQTVFKRYELKYLLTERQKQAVLQAMAEHMELDQYGRTTIRNIYFDTDSYRLMEIEAEGDGISAGYYLHITGGTFDILAGGGYENGAQHSSNSWGGFPGGGGWGGGRPGKSGSSGTTSTEDDSTSMKGIKSASAMRLDGGNFTVDSADDSLHSDTDMTITGGTFIGTGSTMMAQSFSDSTQGVIAVKVGTQSAGTQITLADKNGKVIISHAPELSFQVVILSSPDMVSGETYTITVGSQSGEFEAS